MAKRRITKRWLLNSFGIILLILIAIEILSAYGLKSYYYNGVQANRSITGGFSGWPFEAVRTGCFYRLCH